jgi:hypothetical protein
VRPEFIISEAEGDANWMFGQDSRSLRAGAKVAVSWERAHRHQPANRLPPQGDVALKWGSGSLSPFRLCKRRVVASPSQIQCDVKLEARMSKSRRRHVLIPRLAL